MTAVELVLTVALAFFSAFGGIALYAYRQDRREALKQSETARKMAESALTRVQLIEIRMAKSDEKHESHGHSFERIEKKLDEMAGDIKDLLLYWRNGGPKKTP